MLATQRQPDTYVDLLGQTPPSREQLRRVLQRLNRLCLVPAIAERSGLFTETLNQLSQCVNQCFAVEECLGIFSDLVPSAGSLRARAAALLVQRQRLQAEIRSLANDAANGTVYSNSQAAEALALELQDHQRLVDRMVLDCLEFEVDAFCTAEEDRQARK